MSLTGRISSFAARLPVAARVSLLLFFLASVADGALMPFFALWALKVAHVEVQWIGVLFGCYAGGELLATPLIGGLADRFGRRRVLLASSAGVGLGFMLLLFARGPVEAAGCLIIIGVFESTLHPTATTVVADVAAPGRLTESIAWLRLASNAGSMVGPALGTLFALVSLRFVFVGAGLSLLIGTVCVAVFLAETRPTAPHGEDDEESLTALTAIFRDRRLTSLLIPVAILGITSSWVESVTPLFANVHGLLSAAGIGLLFTYAGALGVVLQMPLTAASKRYSASAVVAAAGLLQAIALALLLAAPSILLLAAAITSFAVSRMLLGPLSNAIALTMAPIQARATYQAAFGVTNDLRDTAGPAIGTYLFALGAELPWLIGAPVSLLAAAVLALHLRGREASPDRGQPAGRHGSEKAS
jgi:MFS transporter, DHA1 family, tetracycline resistance protein